MGFSQGSRLHTQNSGWEQTRTEHWYVSRPFALAFAALSLWLFVLFYHYPYLPMVDLPQHASQMTLWLSWETPWQGDAHYTPNFRTPYLLVYALARLIASVVGPLLAFKLLIWGAIVANGVALTALAHWRGHSPWLGLIAIPTSLCHAFYFGFISFLATTPLAVLCWGLAYKHGLQPTRKLAAILGSLFCLILVAHGIAFCIAAAGAACLILRNRRQPMLRLSPFLAPIALLVLWILPGSATSSIGDNDWTLPWSQIFDLPASLVGMYRGDRVALLGGTVFLALVALNLGRPERSPWYWLPLAMAVGGYWLFPPNLVGMGWLHARFVGFVIPALFLAFTPCSASGARWPAGLVRRPSAVALTCSAWLLVFSVRLAGFNREAADFPQLVSKLPHGLSIRPLVFERHTDAFPTVPAFLHFPAYYRVEKGGHQGYSFAVYPAFILRFREPRTLPIVDPGAEWRPQLFDAEREMSLYDCVLTRSHVDRTQELFATRPDITVAAQVGSWWAYCNPD